MTLQALSVSAISVTTGRMTFRLDIAPGFPRYATPGLMREVLCRYPLLAHHACVNERGKLFSLVMNDTSLPHVLEHLIIDIQVRENASSQGLLVGTTEWADEAAGKAVVSVSFYDDLCALAALNEGLCFLNNLLAH